MKENTAAINENVSRLLAQLRDYPDAVLIAVAKTFGAAAVAAASAAGIRHIGENYLNEAEEKQRECADLPLEWHFLGAIQRNKTERIAERFDWVHGLDRLVIAQRLGRARAGAGAGALNVFMQVNVDGEASKSGVAVDDAVALALDIAAIDNLQLRGLMVIPAPKPAAAQYDTFCRVAALQQRIIDAGVGLDCLSMGMSADYPQALAAGATHIRIGTAVFGERSKK